MPLAHLILLQVGRNHLRGIEHEGPDYTDLEIISEMAANKIASPPPAPLTNDH